MQLFLFIEGPGQLINRTHIYNAYSTVDSFSLCNGTKLTYLIRVIQKVMNIDTGPFS